MSENNPNQLTPKHSDKTNSPTEFKLKPKHRLFIEGVLNGKSVLQSYLEAGYKGGITSAYDLKHRLKNEFAYLVAQKVTLDDTLNELENLSQRPMLEMADGKITLNQKIRLLQLKLQALKNHSEGTKKEQKFTAFVITTNPDKPTTVNVSEPVDAEVVEDNKEI